MCEPSGFCSYPAANGDGEVELDWSDNSESDLSHYNVYRGTSDGGPYTRINSSDVNDRKSKTRLYLNRKERETITNFHAEAEGITPDKVVEKLLAEVSEPVVRKKDAEMFYSGSQAQLISLSIPEDSVHFIS